MAEAAPLQAKVDEATHALKEVREQSIKINSVREVVLVLLVEPYLC